MSKSYKDYCREAIQRDPKTYKSFLNEDGSLKEPPKMTDMVRRFNDSQKSYLQRKEKDGWKEPEPVSKNPELQITGTEIRVKGRLVNLETLSFPKNCSRKEYKRIWMHNERVKKRIKNLKEKYGITKQI
jgi:hypothetical protein